MLKCSTSIAAFQSFAKALHIEPKENGKLIRASNDRIAADGGSPSGSAGLLPEMRPLSLGVFFSGIWPDRFPYPHKRFVSAGPRGHVKDGVRMVAKNGSRRENCFSQACAAATDPDSGRI
jgi:hypothetical protein